MFGTNFNNNMLLMIIWLWFHSNDENKTKSNYLDNEKIEI